MHSPMGVDGGVSSGSGMIVGPKLGISAFSRSDWIFFFLRKKANPFIHIILHRFIYSKDLNKMKLVTDGPLYKVYVQHI